MFSDDALQLIWNYRTHPKPNDVPHLFSFFTKERVLWNRTTAIAAAGVVTALCERHPECYPYWRVDHLPLIKQAIGIEKSWRAHDDIMWGEFLMNRWLILGTDSAAWELLKLCHTAHSESQRVAAQSACDAICRTIDARPITNANGVVMGKVHFEDMRLQMLRLAREYSALTPVQRTLPFDLIPWSKEFLQERVVLRLDQPAVPSVLLQ